MIKKYKTVSIVYGSSGRVYAEKLNAKIENLQSELRYPIQSKIVMESILTRDILSSVTSLFRDTQICITILTADDVCLTGNDKKCRVRQNVIMELGMALFHLGRENCILLSTFDPRDERVELPSDMNGLEIKQIYDDTVDEVFDQIIKKVLTITASLNSSKGIERYDNLLTRDVYLIDYENLFSDQPAYDTESGKNYGDYVLDSFVDECKTFNHYDERAMYFFERIGLIFAFGLGNHMLDWYKKMEPLLASFTAQDIEESGDKKLLSIVRDVMSLLIRNVYRTAEESNEYILQDMCDEFESITLPENVNPLISMVFYDYKGLAYMGLFDKTKNPEHIKQAIFYFEKVMEEYADRIDFNLNLWSGFVLYNLARAFDRLNDVSPDPELVEKSMKTFSKAVIVRKRWLTPETFNENVKYTLSYEYFIAKLDHLNAMAKTNYKPIEYIRMEYEKVAGEIETYCDKDGRLQGISDVQDRLNRYRSRLN